MTFPLPHQRFPTRALSVHEVHGLRSITTELTTAALHEYDHFANGCQGDASKDSRHDWKLVKQQGDLAIYRDRAIDDNSVAVVEESGRVSRLDLPDDGPIQTLLCVGALPGTLDDVMHGVVSLTAEETMLKSSYVGDNLIDCFVLASIITPTFQDPWRSLTLKWAVNASPLAVRPFVRARDFTYVESTGITTSIDGERVGYHIIHSVGISDTKSNAFVRGNVSLHHIFRQKSPDTVEVHVQAFWQLNGRMTPSIQIYSCVEATMAIARIRNTPDAATKHQELVRANLFSWAIPNLRVLFLPLRFIGYWLQWKIWSPDPNAKQAQTVVDNITYGEGPRFRAATRELYFVDMHGRKVLKYSLSSRKTTVVYEDPNDMLSGLGWLADGRMLIVAMNNRRVLVHDEKARSTEVYADVRDVTAFRANDMVVARSGRAYIGSFGFDMANVAAYSTSAVISVDVKRDIRVEAPDMIFPNGMVITPDGKTLIAAETFVGLLTAFDIGEDGRLSNRRVWADVGSFVDGICLDAEGCVWASIPQSGFYPTAGGLLRVREGGQVLEVLGFGANGIKNSVFACQIGSDDDGKHQLFFMEAVTSFDHLIFKDGPEAAKKNGKMRAIEVSVGPARIPGDDNYCGGHC
ncbi:unnamed protein product [Phytophthora fragariaefolia]|uniref:Unnamed protein product n=1 Tax=Phytophthora fragariaefolia TaxID=1490495 RepID=A0A9W6UCY9_9STRA|nr:unnamed protein product [Phytophthora fragariaefolia]